MDDFDQNEITILGIVLRKKNNNGRKYDGIISTKHEQQEIIQQIDENCQWSA